MVSGKGLKGMAVHTYTDQLNEAPEGTLRQGQLGRASCSFLLARSSFHDAKTPIQQNSLKLIDVYVSTLTVTTQHDVHPYVHHDAYSLTMLDSFDLKTPSSWCENCCLVGSGR